MSLLVCGNDGLIDAESLEAARERFGTQEVRRSLSLASAFNFSMASYVDVSAALNVLLELLDDDERALIFLLAMLSAIEISQAGDVRDDRMEALAALLADRFNSIVVGEEADYAHLVPGGRRFHA